MSSSRRLSIQADTLARLVAASANLLAAILNLLARL